MRRIFFPRKNVGKFFSPIFFGDFYVYLIDLIMLLVILSCNNLGKYRPRRQPE